MSILIEVPTEGYSEEEKETVAYLQYCMQNVDEKGMLARILYNMIAFGRITAEEVGVILGVYEPEGISLDDDDDEDEYDDDEEQEN